MWSTIYLHRSTWCLQDLPCLKYVTILTWVMKIFWRTSIFDVSAVLMVCHPLVCTYACTAVVWFIACFAGSLYNANASSCYTTIKIIFLMFYRINVYISSLSCTTTLTPICGQNEFYTTGFVIISRIGWW